MKTIKVIAVIIFFLTCVSTVSAEKPVDTVASLVLKGAKEQARIKPLYRNEYRTLKYPGGDVPANEGVCTDVVIRACRNAGLDLQVLVHEDMEKNFKLYPQKRIWNKTKPDRNIDHRRCPNLIAFFDRFAEKLTLKTGPDDLKQWQAGDIIFWDLGYGGSMHTGIVSDTKTSDGRPYVIHSYPMPGYTAEEDVLNEWKIIRHYRYSGNI